MRWTLVFACVGLAAGAARAQDTPAPGSAAETGTQAEAGTEAEAETEAETGTAPETGTEAETGTAPETGTEAETPTAPEAETPTAPEPLLPKLAFIVVGDSDPALRARAFALETRLAARRFRFSEDSALRAALRGEPPTDADGLDAVRRERRRLGLEGARDVERLARLGVRAGAEVVVVVYADPTRPRIAVLDVRTGQLVPGDLALSEDDAHLARFVGRRARAVAREAAAAAAAPPHVPDFFEQYWPYFVAAGLLAGAITAFVLIDQSSGTAVAPAPVLRFGPGN